MGTAWVSKAFSTAKHPMSASTCIFFTPWHCLALGTGDIRKCQCLLTWHARAPHEPSKQAWPLVLPCTLLRIYIRSPKLELRVHSNSKLHHELWPSATVSVAGFPPNELYAVALNKPHSLGLLSFRNSVSRSYQLSRIALRALFALSARLSAEDVHCCPGCDFNMTPSKKWFWSCTANVLWTEENLELDPKNNSHVNPQFMSDKPFLVGFHWNGLTGNFSDSFI